jgi:hypothetical protein
MNSPSLLHYPRRVLCTDTGGFQCIERWEEYDAEACQFDRALNTTVLLIRLPDSGMLVGIPSRLFIDTGRYPSQRTAEPIVDARVYTDDPEAGIF